MTETTKLIPAPKIKSTLDRLKNNIKEVIKGKDDVIDQVLICLTATGHLLIEDLPGLGKTPLAYCLARSIVHSAASNLPAICCPATLSEYRFTTSKLRNLYSNGAPFSLT